MIEALEALAKAGTRADGRAPVIGVAGCQGSGKTTLCREAAARWGGAQISLDDVYLTRAERAVMARDVHPLFQTRGPPGTQDLELLGRTIERLRTAGPEDETPLPAFDKLRDDRQPETAWPRFRGRPGVILIDAWCLGALPQDEAALVEPVNALERESDPAGTWRREVNRRLAGEHARLRNDLDGLLFLRAPGFETVLDWRCEQEAGLRGVTPEALPGADRARLGGFVAHFERLTRHMLAGGISADVVLKLDGNRRVID